MDGKNTKDGQVNITIEELERLQEDRVNNDELCALLTALGCELRIIDLEGGRKYAHVVAFNGKKLLSDNMSLYDFSGILLNKMKKQIPIGEAGEQIVAEENAYIKRFRAEREAEAKKKFCYDVRYISNNGLRRFYETRLGYIRADSYEEAYDILTQKAKENGWVSCQLLNERPNDLKSEE